MGNSLKTKCLYLPAQSGKTRKVEDIIREKQEYSQLFDETDINIIISANNKLLVEQTRTRMTNDLATDSEPGSNDACIKGNVFSWMSGTKENNISPHALAFDLVMNKIDMVVICAHPIRMRYLNEAIDLVHQFASVHPCKKKINIWVDEADKSINLWSKYEKIVSLSLINQVTLVSATFGSVIARYKEIRVLPYLDTHPKCYRRLVDMTKVAVDIVASSSIDYIKSILERTVDDHGEKKLCAPGMRGFIPGDITKDSHNEIAEMLFKQYNFVVIVINGDRKEILVPGEEPIDMTQFFTLENGEVGEEFNVQLAKLYKENNWNRFPLAITGFYCISRGITFQCDANDHGIHDGFLFDYGIIPTNITNKSEAYQIMARLFGNIGDFINWKPCDIYTSSAMFTRVTKQEEIAVNLARIVAERHNEMVGKREISEAQNATENFEYDFSEKECFTRDEMIEYLSNFNDDDGDDGNDGREKLKKVKKVRNISNKEIIPNADGFVLSSTTRKKGILNYDDVIAETKLMKHTSLFDIKDCKKMEAGKSFRRIICCYYDVTDPSTLVIICRIITKK